MIGLKCPNCGKRGGVICRVDAYAIYKLGEDGEMKMIDTVLENEMDRSTAILTFMVITAYCITLVCLALEKLG